MGEANDSTGIMQDITAPALFQNLTGFAYYQRVDMDVLALSLHNGIGKVL